MLTTTRSVLRSRVRSRLPIALSALTLRICLPELPDTNPRLPFLKSFLLRWELVDAAGELVAARPWRQSEHNTKAATLRTLENALTFLASMPITCPHLAVKFPEIDPRTHDKAFAMLRKRPRPTLNRSFETYLAA